MNCWLELTVTDAALGDTLIEERLTAAELTFRVAVPWVELYCAVMVTVPAFAPVANPELLTLATFESDEFH